MSIRHRSPSPSRDGDADDAIELGNEMGFAMADFANASGLFEAAGQVCMTATEDEESPRFSTDILQPEDEVSHSTTQRQASNDILKLLGIFEPAFIITMFHIRRHRRYRLRVTANMTAMELATSAAADEGVGVEKINLLQDNVVNAFCGDSYMYDGKGDITLGELQIGDGDRINVAVGTQVVVFPRSEWSEDATGKLKLKGTPWQRFQEMQRQRDEAKRRDSAHP